MLGEAKIVKKTNPEAHEERNRRNTALLQEKGEKGNQMKAREMEAEVKTRKTKRSVSRKNSIWR